MWTRPKDSPEKSIVPEVIPPPSPFLRIGSWTAPITRKSAGRVLKAILILPCAEFAKWGLQNFFTLRGIVNLLASRINLAFVWIGLFAIVWILTFGVKRKVLIRVCGGVLLLLAVYGLDVWAPKPNPPLSNAAQSTNSVPNPTHKSLPGMSLHMIIRIHNLAVNRRKYLFDFGREKAGRLSIYISSDNIFTFGFLDAEGEFHPVQIPLGSNGVPLNEFFYLSCGLGLNGQTTEMIMLIDGEQKGALELPFRVDVGLLDVPGGVVGADLSGQNGAKIDIKEFFAYSKTLDDKDLDGLRNYLKMRLNTVHQYVEFNGDQWMRVNQVGRRNATQKNKKHQPIYRIESATS